MHRLRRRIPSTDGVIGGHVRLSGGIEEGVGGELAPLMGVWGRAQLFVLTVRGTSH